MRSTSQGKAPDIIQKLQQGTSLGRALVDADLPWEIRELLLGHYVTEELAASLDRHYVLDSMGDDEGAMMAEQWVDDTLAASAQARRRAQLIGALALIPFVGAAGPPRRQPRRAAVPRVVRRLRRGDARHRRHSEDARAGAA